MTMNNSKTLLVAVSLVSVTLLAILVFGVYSIQVKNEKTSALLNSADSSAETAVLVQSIRAVQKSAGEDIQALEGFVLTESKLVPFIESIEKTGQVLGLDTNILSVEETVSKKLGEPKIVRIVIEAKGSWSGTLSFLRAIESLPHKVMIEESSFSKEETGWRLRIVLSLYSFD